MAGGRFRGEIRRRREASELRRRAAAVVKAYERDVALDAAMSVIGELREQLAGERVARHALSVEVYRLKQRLAEMEW